jgi:glycosyltransferase involved in cell wall biosynthesis
MRYTSLLFLCFLTLTFSLAKEPSKQLEFVIIIPSYNNEKVAERSLASAVGQKTSLPYHVYYINDASTDKTGTIVDTYIKKHHLESQVTVIHNKTRVGALENIYTTIHSHCEDHQVVALLDGDDFLSPVGLSLLRVEQEYKDPATWMTYGQFVYYPDGLLGYCREIPREVFEERKIRHYPFVAQHLRTFKAGLFKKIKKEDLMHQGKFFPMTGDMAVMIPLLEMCAPHQKNGKLHAQFIPDIIYIYNNRNPLSDYRIDRELQYYLETIIRGKTPYEPLDNL